MAEGVWAPGVVEGQLIREPSMPPGEVAPYQVKLNDGRLILLREDCESQIRSAHPPAEEEDDDDDSSDDGEDEVEDGHAQHQHKRLKS